MLSIITILNNKFTQLRKSASKWPSKRGPTSKIGPSNGCGRDEFLMAVERWYDFPEVGDYLGDVGSNTFS